MIFEFTVTVPAATTAAAPVVLELPLARGILHKAEVIFPPGCHSKVFLVLRRALHQVLPTNSDGQFKGDFFPISYPTWYELEAPPYQLEAYAWAPDTTYAHDVIVRLGILPREILVPPQPEAGLLSRIARLLGIRG